MSRDVALCAYIRIKADDIVLPWDIKHKFADCEPGLSPNDLGMNILFSQFQADRYLQDAG